MPSPEKFRETLDEFEVKKEIIDEMCCGFGNVSSKTSKKIKSSFFRQALEVMNEKLPSETVQEILEANACCKSGARLKTQKSLRKFTQSSAFCTG